MVKRALHVGLVGCALLGGGCGVVVESEEQEAPAAHVSSALAAPAIASLDVASGAAGTPVTLTGSGFGATKGTSAVKFRGNLAPIVSWSDTQIVCTVPPSATAGDLGVWVTVSGVDSAAVPFAIVPSVASIVPAYAAPGSSVTLDGANFGTLQHASTVTIGGAPAVVSSWGMRSIVVTVPSTVTGPAPVVVTVNGKASAPKTLATTAPTAPPASAYVAGREVVYAWIDSGSTASADKILTDVWPVDRFPDAALPSDLTWTENPFGDASWRAQFYGFRPLRHLLAAYRSTGNDAYRTKLLSVVADFAASGQTSAFSRDRYATATRGLVLVDVFWKLRAANALSDAEADTLVGLLSTTAQFLADAGNYDANDSRALTEATALLAIAKNFPGLDGATTWESTATSRLQAYVDGEIDAGGISQSRSVNTELQLLGMISDIAKWARTYAPATGAMLDAKIDAMALPAAHLLQPDGWIPMVGASPAWNVRASASTFADVSQSHPLFAYALSGGTTGTPPDRVLDLGTSGWTVMRSGWASGPQFSDETQVFFDWRTAASSKADRDLLNVLVYAAGRPLLVDSGMYSSTTGTAVDAYFKSTAGHNTVVVDGQTQALGAAYAGPVASLVNIHLGDTSPYARTAGHSVYPGVVHSRSAALLGKNIVMVVDRLQSTTSHTYEQVWHLTPAATQLASSTGTETGPVVRGLDTGGTPLVRIATRYALADGGSAHEPDVTTVRGSDAPVDGWVSSAAGARAPGWSVHYKAQGTTVVFVTLVTSGSAVSDEPQLYPWADPDWSEGYVWNTSGTYLDRWLDVQNDASGSGIASSLNDGD